MLWRSFAIALVFACITAGFAALRIVLAFDYVWVLLLTFVAFMLALFGVSWQRYGRDEPAGKGAPIRIRYRASDPRIAVIETPTH